MNQKQGFVYILTSKWNTVLYVGVTSDLVKRIYEHKQKFVDGFTKKYNLHKLVYYEMFETITEAIEREKVIKGWLRKKKIVLVQSMNPEWKDLFDTLI